MVVEMVLLIGAVRHPSGCLYFQRGHLPFTQSSGRSSFLKSGYKVAKEDKFLTCVFELHYHDSRIVMLSNETFVAQWRTFRRRTLGQKKGF